MPLGKLVERRDAPGNDKVPLLSQYATELSVFAVRNLAQVQSLLDRQKRRREEQLKKSGSKCRCGLADGAEEIARRSERN